MAEHKMMSEISASELMAQLDQLARFSDEDHCLTRTYLTSAHRAAGDQLIAWMRAAGMRADFDPVGNVVGRYEGDEPGLPALLLGSHFDTVRDAGQFDGMYGIVAAIACVAALNRKNQRLPFAIEVLAFADEEGVRFGATLLGSRAVAGTFDYTVLENTDAQGIRMRDALSACGHDPGTLDQASYTRRRVLAYVELHIEQGPVLLSENTPVGIVTAIAGASRYDVVVDGLAGHAGTVPMSLRRDAAAAAADALLAVERHCTSGDGLVGTVGQLQVINGAVNVVPGRAEFSVDVRSGDNAAREVACADILAEFSAIGQRRNVTFTITPTHAAQSAVCAPWLIDQLSAAVSRQALPPRYLASGAGHDAMALPGLTDIAMLFVRCGNGGISHHPDETMTGADAQCAAEVLLDFIRHFQPRSN